MVEKPPFEYDEIDPQDPESWGRALEIINDDEGPLAKKAAGDTNYLRFLREDAVAQLDLLRVPEDPDVRDRATQTREMLDAFEATYYPGP